MYYEVAQVEWLQADDAESSCHSPAFYEEKLSVISYLMFDFGDETISTKAAPNIEPGTTLTHRCGREVGLSNAGI